MLGRDGSLKCSCRNVPSDEKHTMERSYANSGKEWSDMDVADLQQCVKIGMAEMDIAGFLRCPTNEIRERAAELVGISLGPAKDDKSQGQY
jgi:hypothetical protein